jgi:type III secretion protein S
VTEQTIMQHAGSMLMLVLLLSLPVLGVAAAVGFLIALVQAVTQIQDHTLPQVVKLAAVLVTLLLLGPWMAQPILAEAEQIFAELARSAP